MKSDYRHQCRYCAHCVFTINETFWCDELDKDCMGPKRPNKCASWLFQPIAADAPDCSIVYRQKRKRNVNETQMKLFDMPTNKKIDKNK